MTKETLGYVKLEWTCQKCGSRNPGPEKTCRGCGAPQPENVEFVQAAEETLSQDETLKEIAQKGPDIHCSFCGARNPGDAAVCSQCGADLTQGTRREAGKVLGAYQPTDVKQVACPNCQAENPQTALFCRSCGAPLIRKTDEKVVAPTAARPLNRFLILGLIGGVILLCILGVIAFRALVSPRESKLAIVQQMQWQTRIPVEEFGPVKQRDWQANIPPQAEIGVCEDRVYQTVSSQPFEGNYNKICGTPYTIDTGSGVGQVVQDCQFQVLKPYCEFVVQDWTVVDELSLSGNDLNPIFPNPQLAADQRLGRGTTSYLIVFDSDGKKYSYPVSSFSEYEHFSLGSRWKLNINALGQIVSVEANP